MTTTAAMPKLPEHSPAPTPDRAVYGFVLYLMFKTFMVLYFLWALIPTSILENVFGIDYLPDKYFAVILPILVLLAVMIFGFWAYPALTLSMQPKINALNTIRDSYSIYRCKYRDERGSCNNRVDIPMDDWSIESYCKQHCASPTVDMVEQRIQNYCDCPNNEYCLLKSKPNHLNWLLSRKSIPTVSDLDIRDVSRLLFLRDAS